MQRMRGTREGVLVAIAIIAAFVFFLVALILSYQTSLDAKTMSSTVSPLVKYHLYFMVAVSTLGIAVGASVFYFMSRRVETTQSVAKKTGEIVLRFLSSDERRVLEAMSARNGSMLQRDFSREHGLSKVKTHRVVARLAERGIVTLDEHGKTNRVTLDPQLLAALKE
jgi:uncharacterized membrane protein